MYTPTYRRTGAVTVETALALPILFLFTFTGIEFTRVNMIRNTVVNAAYEGARKGIVPGATASECVAAADQLLDTTSISGATVSASPSPILPTSESITVTVTVPITSTNSFVTPQFYMGQSITSTITLPREGHF